MRGAMLLPTFVAPFVAPLVAGALAATVAGRVNGGEGPHTRQLTYLALGDSYTIGESVETDGRWPMQLARQLRAHGLAVEDPRIVARTGWTTDELSAAIDEEFGSDAGHAFASSPRFDLVTLLIGVNNQYRGRSVEEFEMQFDALLARAIAFAGGREGRVIVLAIPDWGVTPFAAQSWRNTADIARELDAFNASAARLCAARGIAFVDIAPVSRSRGMETVMLADDGLHPSAAMYAQWAALAWPVARDLLQVESQ